MAERPDQPKRSEHGREAEEQRNACGNECPEREQQDDQGHRDRGVLGLVEVAACRRRSGPFRRSRRRTRRSAAEGRPLRSRRRLQGILDVVLCLVAVAGDVEGDEHRAAVGRTQGAARLASGERISLTVGSERSRARRSCDADGEAGVADSDRSRSLARAPARPSGTGRRARRSWSPAATRRSPSARRSVAAGRPRSRRRTLRRRRPASRESPFADGGRSSRRPQQPGFAVASSSRRSTRRATRSAHCRAWASCEAVSP